MILSHQNNSALKVKKWDPGALTSQGAAWVRAWASLAQALHRTLRSQPWSPHPFHGRAQVPSPSLNVSQSPPHQDSLWPQRWEKEAFPSQRSCPGYCENGYFHIENEWRVSWNQWQITDKTKKGCHLWLRLQKGAHLRALTLGWDLGVSKLDRSQTSEMKMEEDLEKVTSTARDLKDRRWSA